MKKKKKKYKNQMGFEFLLRSESETLDNKSDRAVGEVSHFPCLFFLTFSLAFDLQVFHDIFIYLFY